MFDLAAPTPTAAIPAIRRLRPPVAAVTSATKPPNDVFNPVMIGPKDLIAVPALRAPVAKLPKSPVLKALAKPDNDDVHEVIEP